MVLTAGVSGCVGSAGFGLSANILKKGVSLDLAGSGSAGAGVVGFSANIFT